MRSAIDGKRPAEILLIKRCFLDLSGNIALDFYLQQALATADKQNIAMAGGEGTNGGAARLAGVSDVSSWQETADVSQKGEVSILTRIKTALNNDDRNEIFRVADTATEQQRRQALGDSPTMGLLRSQLRAVDFDRVYAVLAGTADMTTRLYSRSQGDVSGTFSRATSFKDTDGIQRDIKDYAARRQEVHTREVEDAHQDPSSKENQALIMQKTRDDLIAAYDSPEARQVIQNDFPAWFHAGVDANGRKVEGMMLNGGGESNTSAVMSEGFVWSSDILAQVKAMTPEQRQKYRADPEFLRAAWERCVDQQHRRLILLGLQSDEKSGEDHILGLVELSGGLSSGEPARELVAKLSQGEIVRLRREPDLVLTINEVLNQDEQARLRSLLAFDTKAAMDATGARAVNTPAPPPGGPGAPQASAVSTTTNTTPAGPQGTVPSADSASARRTSSAAASAPLGRVSKDEVERLGYLRLQSQQRLHLGAHTSWERLIRDSIEVFKADFKPKFQAAPGSAQPPGAGAAAPPTTIDDRRRDEVRDRAAAPEDLGRRQRQMRSPRPTRTTATTRTTARSTDGRDEEARPVGPAADERAVVVRQRRLRYPADDRRGVRTEEILNAVVERRAAEVRRRGRRIVPGGLHEVQGHARRQAGADREWRAAAGATDAGFGAGRRGVPALRRRAVGGVRRSCCCRARAASAATRTRRRMRVRARRASTRRTRSTAASWNDRIRAPSTGPRSPTTIGATDPQDAAAVASKLRGALTNFQIAQENYGQHRDAQTTFRLRRGPPARSLAR